MSRKKSCISENPAYVKIVLIHYLKITENWLIILWIKNKRKYEKQRIYRLEAQQSYNNLF